MRAHVFYLNNVGDGYLVDGSPIHKGWHSACILQIADDNKPDNLNEAVYLFLQNDNPHFDDRGWIERQTGEIRVEGIYTDMPRSMSVGDKIVWHDCNGKVLAAFKVTPSGFDNV